MVTRMLSFQQIQQLSILQLMSSGKATLEYISRSRAMDKTETKMEEILVTAAPTLLLMISAAWDQEKALCDFILNQKFTGQRFQLQFA